MRHPLTLLTNEVPAIRLQPDHACLILQDIHNPFADVENGWLARRSDAKILRREFDEYFDMLGIVSANFPVLANACRQSGIDVVYLSLGLPFKGEASPFQQACGWIWDVDGPEWGFPVDWQPSQDDYQFVKPGWGALGSPDFAAYLRSRSIRSVIVAGTMYDYGIRHTCYQLVDEGIAALVASDAVVAATFAGQSQTSGNLAHGFTKLRSTAEILDLLAVMREDGQVLV